VEDADAAFFEPIGENTDRVLEMFRALLAE
jgi:hypothetical protein